MALPFVKKPGTRVRLVAKKWPRPLRLLSVRDAAAFAKVSTQTVRRLIKAGKLKSYRAGRQIRIDEADLIANISSHETK